MTRFSSLIFLAARRSFIVASIVAALAGVAALNTGAQAQSSAPAKEIRVNDTKVEEGEAYAKQLLLLMDRDKSGKISHEEFMTFMEAEFQRLDKNHDGELDVKELTQTRLVHGGGHR